MKILHLFFAAAICAQGSLAAEAETTAPAKTIRLLTVGNSFSGNATRHLPDLAKAAGHKLIHRRISIGGASLELHFKKTQANAKDPADKAGLYADGKSLKDILKQDRWDYVTIQQASIKSHNLETYRPHATELHGFIKQHAPQAQVLVHQTWAYRVDDPRFASRNPKPGEPATQEEMYRGLSSAYGTIAKELGSRRIPVGDAFYLADTNSQWGYTPDTNFDLATAKEPALPNQTHSLHIGWIWKKQRDGTTKLTMDGHHANLAGEYLGGCVWFEVLFGESVVGNRFVPPGLAPDYARFLQETAHAAVAKGVKQ